MYYRVTRQQAGFLLLGDKVLFNQTLLRLT